MKYVAFWIISSLLLPAQSLEKLIEREIRDIVTLYMQLHTSGAFVL
jgi:hypothetical protein